MEQEYKRLPFPKLKVYKSLEAEEYMGVLFETVKIVDKKTKEFIREEEQPIRHGFFGNSAEQVKDKAVEHWDYCQDKNAELYGNILKGRSKSLETRIKNKIQNEAVER